MEIGLSNYSLPLILTVVIGIIYKAAPAIPDRWKSLITIGAGVGIGVAAMFYHGGPYTGKVVIDFLLLGLMTGAAAIGLYEGKKAVSSNPRE